MSITKEVYHNLELVVGEDNISDDPVICAAAIGGANGINVWDRGAIRPACVILPKDTGEVQKIVLIANRYNIPYIPTSASMSVFVSAKHPNTIIIDLKRMRTLEINEENMYAICGPGICGAELFAEVTKKGLWCVIPASGGQCSVVANTAIHGMAPSIYRFGFPYRRILATEWVLPNGELINLGSSSISNDFFWGEGPGPDLRGILRGTLGPLGGMGIVTKMGIKLLPFQPEALHASGTSPKTFLELPANRLMWVNSFFPSFETAIDAIYEISKNEIGSMVMVIPTLFVTVAKSRGKGAAWFWKNWNKVPDNVDWQNTFVRVLLVGSASEKQLEFEQKILEEIVNEFGGKTKIGRPVDESQLVCPDAICSFFVSGTFHCCELTFESLDAAVKTARKSAELRKKYQNILAEDHGYPGWLYPAELGHMCYYEFLAYGDVEDKESLAKLALDCMQSDIEVGGFPMYQDPSILGPKWFNYHGTLRGLKDLLDPNNVSNPPYPERLPWNTLPEGMIDSSGE